MDLIDLNLKDGETLAEYGLRTMQLMEVVKDQDFDLDKFASVRHQRVTR